VAEVAEVHGRQAEAVLAVFYKGHQHCPQGHTPSPSVMVESEENIIRRWFLQPMEAPRPLTLSLRTEAVLEVGIRATSQEQAVVVVAVGMDRRRVLRGHL